ncbi:capsular polysaccharide biosynthesis protein [Staphylococcus piscifermentans]|uniref:Tyrosine-protein phosphatase n=1 Tax=Staphylococcus piscifermentans TaxID=70258 RepID=A0A239TEL1_9STAP|nr:CpsB/CapC family capsule biosynthesis tyrosine phosphatase [Staphylococcus piscifermentans]RTX86697.1 capsular biosynthesis protein [Staphylococcus piscifermentans]GEP83664.1 capsular polysaccharide biosynthesis protein Cap8C [Staphylococcus piscifermentans]SNU96097.1 capsular polysaccharide biosynthesis protein [Staphylococcus piscifermentans]
MIDIHNHVLPRLDDGPKNEEEMMKLLKQASSQGITGIVATPHHLHPSYSNEFNDIEKQVEKLNDKTEIKELGLTLYPGQEVRITDQIFKEIDENKIHGINYTNYILIELPSGEVPHYTKRVIYELQTKSFIPVIVHPERNKAIAKDINLLFELINIGALSQITASSLTGEMGRNIQNLVFKMIEHNLVHFVASDAHRVSQRPFGFKELFSTSKIKKYENEINIFLDNNKALVSNENVKKYRPVEYKKKKILGLF